MHNMYNYSLWKFIENCKQNIIYLLRLAKRVAWCNFLYAIKISRVTKQHKNNLK